MRKPLLLVYGLFATSALAQDYVWPTNASQWITSTFGESRPRRFHAGMDVKTWNRVGYQAIAVRDGYVMRIRVSPFGYGRALYLKLDNGEIAVYAHLLKYNDHLQAIVEDEQERRGRYSITKEFPPGAIPVKKGEVVAYTGQTGIGVPHLHFELRTAADHPTNPLRMGIPLSDKSPPQILALAVRPLTPGSTVNDDFRPQIFQPALRNGWGWRQQIDRTFTISGKIGFAISAYDYAAGVDNRYSVYSLKFFVDDELQFQSSYDALDFDHNRFVELDRDFALDHHGYGEFYKLYREPGNPLTFYRQLNAWGGALLIKEKSDSSPSATALPGEENFRHQSRGRGAGISWGMHRFRIELSDYFGNMSTLEGQFLAGPSFRIEPIPGSSDSQTLSIKQITAAREIRDVEVYVKKYGSEPAGGGGDDHALEPHRQARKHDGGWKRIPAMLQTILQPRPDGAAAPVPESAPPQLTINIPDADLIQLVAIDADSLRSLPYFMPASFLGGTAAPMTLQIHREFYHHYMRVEIEASQPIASAPVLTVSVDREETKRPLARPLQPELLPVEPNISVGQVPLANLDGEVTLEAAAEDYSGRRATASESFSLTQIPANGAGSLVAPDRRMQMNFWGGSLFGSPLYGWVEIDSTAPAEPLRLSPVYRCVPQDVPLSGGANVVITLADSISGLQQLGVYTRDKNKWSFVDNRLEAGKRQVWARADALGDFTVFRDNQPPELGRSEPGNGARVRTGRPLISVEVKDTMSGFESEEAIVLQLDGRKVIAEYDPERDVVFYTPRQPLSSGRHEYTLRAVDRSGNVAEKTAGFVVP